VAKASADNGSRRRIAIALGSGSARGWAHIGILRALSRMGVRPDIVCGCSIGALVGAAYANGRLEELANAVTGLGALELVRFFELDLGARGFVDTPRLRTFLEDCVAGPGDKIGDLPLAYGSVATDLQTGQEIWLQDGPLLDAAWASFTMPGLFPPVRNGGRWLVDGGLVNPVPVSLARALRADVVIAVNLNGDLVGRHLNPPHQSTRASPMKSITAALREQAPMLFKERDVDEAPTPWALDTAASAINIMQDRITRSRMAGDPPDVLLSPRLGHIRLLEFHRAQQAIAEGEACVERARATLDFVLG